MAQMVVNLPSNKRFDANAAAWTIRNTLKDICFCWAYLRLLLHLSSPGNQNQIIAALNYMEGYHLIVVIRCRQKPRYGTKLGISSRHWTGTYRKQHNSSYLTGTCICPDGG